MHYMHRIALLSVGFAPLVTGAQSSTSRAGSPATAPPTPRTVPAIAYTIRASSDSFDYAGNLLGAFHRYLTGDIAFDAGRSLTRNVVFATGRVARGRSEVVSASGRAAADDPVGNYALFDPNEEIRVQPRTHSFTAPTTVAPLVAAPAPTDSEVTIDSAFAEILEDTVAQGDSVAGFPTMERTLALRRVSFYHATGLGVNGVELRYVRMRTVQYWVARPNNALRLLRDALTADPERPFAPQWSENDSAGQVLSDRVAAFMASGVILKRVTTMLDSSQFGSVSPTGSAVDTMEVSKVRQLDADVTTLILPNRLVLQGERGTTDEAQFEKRMQKWWSIGVVPRPPT
jgi:hypothetical protein